MFKNFKIVSLLLLCGCTVTNKEKIYTDLKPTIPASEDDYEDFYIKDKNIFACNFNKFEEPQNYCDKDGKLFNGTITQIEDDYKEQYILKNGKAVKLNTFTNEKLETSANIKMKPNDSYHFTQKKYYDKNGKVSSEYKFDDGETNSTLKIFCPDGSIEKEIIIRQDVTSKDINIFKETNYHKIKSNGWLLPISKFEHLTLKKEEFGTIGFYTGKIDILDCNGDIVETLNFENGKKIN